MNKVSEIHTFLIMKSAFVPQTAGLSVTPHSRPTGFPSKLFATYSARHLYSAQEATDFEYHSDEQETCRAQVIPPSIELPRMERIQGKCTTGSTTPLSPQSGDLQSDLHYERLTGRLEVYEQAKVKAGKELLRAVQSGNVSDTEALLQGTFPGFVAANINLRTARRETLLHAVSRTGSTPICQLLLDHGILPEGATPNECCQSPVHLACHFGHLGVVRLLVKAGADLSAEDWEGNTPLHCAALARHFDITKYLRLSGANVNIRNKQGKTASDCQSMKTLTDLRKTLHVPSIKTAILPSRKSAPPAFAHPQPADFEVLGQLGEGSFGEVYLVRDLISGQKYALKAMKKGRVLAQKMTKYAFTERNVLCRAQSPFVVTLHAAFQNAESLFLQLDYCPGGDLAYYLAREKRFSEHKARIYICELVLALEELHRHDIIYRDLKPSNIVLTADGHIRLTDFGLAKEGVRDHYAARSFCGSVGYLAPEMVKKQGHGKAADWYMLGTLLYELLTGSIPFFSRDRDTLLRNMETGSLSFPMSLSAVAKDFISAVLPT